MKIFDYRGFQISIDPSYIDNKVLENQPYTFHLDKKVLHIYFNPRGHPLVETSDHPLTKLKVKKKKEIKRLIDENYGELIIKTNVGEINDNFADILELP